MAVEATKKTGKNLLRLIGDGWQNVTSGFGTSRDKRVDNRIKAPAPSSDRQRWEDLYHADDLGARIVDKPSGDMIRKWIDVNVDQGGDDSETRGADAKLNVEIADDTLQKLDDLDAKAVLNEALVWSKVYGGSLVFMGIDDGGGVNPKSMLKPLDESRIRSFDSLTVFDRWEIHVHSEYTDPIDPDPKIRKKFGRPQLYRIDSQGGVRGSTQHSVIVHESRFLRFDGVLTGKRRRLRNDGWSDPVFVRIEEILADFGISWASAAHLLQDYSQGVFKMKGLADAVAAQEGNLVLGRMAIMDQCRSSLRTIPIDADDEDFLRQATPMTGIPDILDRFMIRLAAAAGMPVSIMFGMGARGLDNTADGDIELWHEQIEAMQETTLRSPIERLIELIFKTPDGPTRGRDPDGWRMTFNPLTQATEKESAELRSTQSETDERYISLGVVSEEEIRQSRFGGERYSTDTIINNEPSPADDPEASLEVTEPGLADRFNSSHLSPICDPASSRYDPKKCAERRQRSDQAATTVQTLIFDKDRFTRAQVISWASDHDMSSSKVDETGESFRLRQREPSDFIDGSFRTITLRPGVQAVIGRPR